MKNTTKHSLIINKRKQHVLLSIGPIDKRTCCFRLLIIFEIFQNTGELGGDGGGGTLIFLLHRPGADLIKLFSLLLPLRTGRTEIKCTGTPVLAYAGVLHLPRRCRQNSHVTCSKIKWRSTAYTVLRYFRALPIGSDNYSY